MKGAFCGVCEEVPEKMMDAVTGLSGFGGSEFHIQHKGSYRLSVMISDR